jgi:hypothetical protein
VLGLFLAHQVDGPSQEQANGGSLARRQRLQRVPDCLAAPGIGLLDLLECGRVEPDTNDSAI